MNDIDLDQALRLTIDDKKIFVLEGVENFRMSITFKEKTWTSSDGAELPGLEFFVKGPLHQGICDGYISWGSWNDQCIGDGWFILDDWRDSPRDTARSLSLINELKKEAYPKVKARLGL